METALLKVQTDITEALDKDCMAVLIVLDLPTAFDTLYHDILLNIHLNFSFGIQAEATKWFGSYLTNRVQSVAVS